MHLVPQDRLHVSPSLDGFLPQPPYMWTKLRPGVRAFLRRASELFELHVCTMGDRSYAEQMAALLDPRRTLFAERIVSSVRRLSHEPGWRAQLVLKGHRVPEKVVIVQNGRGNTISFGACSATRRCTT